MRTLAIGDVHGCLTALERLLAAVRPTPDDILVTLGDYVDRGPDSRGVLDLLIGLYEAGRVVPLRGNHELMMLDAHRDFEALRGWMACGGREALASYATQLDRLATPDDVPARHWKFIEEDCLDWYELETHFFVHANASADLALEDQPSYMLHWEPLRGGLLTARPHESGKTMVCGHTSQKSGLPLNLGHAICIDTYCYGGGWLTCLHCETGKIWQANQRGEVREGWLPDPDDQ